MIAGWNHRNPRERVDAFKRFDLGAWVRCVDGEGKRHRMLVPLTHVSRETLSKCASVPIGSEKRAERRARRKARMRLRLRRGRGRV